MRILFETIITVLVFSFLLNHLNCLTISFIGLLLFSHIEVLLFSFATILLTLLSPFYIFHIDHFFLLSFFSVEFLWPSIVLWSNPALFLHSDYSWLWILDLFHWFCHRLLLFWLFSFNSFEDIVKLFIDRFIFRMHCPMFLKKILANFKLFLNISSDWIVKKVHYLIWMSAKVETLVDWVLNLEDSGLFNLLSLGLLAV